MKPNRIQCQDDRLLRMFGGPDSATEYARECLRINSPFHDTPTAARKIVVKLREEAAPSDLIAAYAAYCGVPT